MLNCIGKEKIYVICPAEYKTGGTELLHQLVYTLNKNGLKAYITYFNINRDKEPINESFKKYVSIYKSLDDIIDSKNNIIVLPEIKVDLLKQFGCMPHLKNNVWKHITVAGNVLWRLV